MFDASVQDIVSFQNNTCHGHKKNKALLEAVSLQLLKEHANIINVLECFEPPKSYRNFPPSKFYM